MSRFDRAVLTLLRAPTYSITVHEIDDLTAHCRRIHFTAPELLNAHEISPTFWLRLWIPVDGQEYQRAYTVTHPRREAGLFAADFVLHDTPGVATNWARTATPGSTLRATIYTGKLFSLPQPAPRGYLLLGDPASLPAINDILRALPTTVPAHVMLQRQHDDDADLPLSERDGEEVTWATSDSGLLDLVRDLDADLTGWHAWAATEAGVTRRLRALLQTQHGLPRTAVTARGYWIAGKPMGRSG